MCNLLTKLVYDSVGNRVALFLMALAAIGSVALMVMEPQYTLFGIGAEAFLFILALLLAIEYYYGPFISPTAPFAAFALGFLSVCLPPLWEAR